MSDWEKQVREGLRARGGLRLRNLECKQAAINKDVNWINAGIDFELDSGPSIQRVQAVRFGPGAGLRLLAVQGMGSKGSHAATLSRMLDHGKALAEENLPGFQVAGAVNGGFFIFVERLTSGRKRFWPSAARVGDSLGLLMSNGKLVSLPVFNRAALCQLETGQVLVRRFGMRDLEFRFEARPVKVTYNELFVDRIACFDPCFSHPSTPRDPMRIDSVWINNREAARRPGGGTPIPINGCVFSFPKPLLGLGEPKLEIFGPQAEGARVRDAVTAGPVLIRGGVSLSIDEGYLNSQGFEPNLPPLPKFNSILHHYEAAAPRLVAGVDSDGGAIFVLVEGRIKGEAEGVTLAQASRIARGFGLVEALNLDGGASAEIILEDQPLNVPQLGRRRPVLEAMLGLLRRLATPGTLPGPEDLGAGAERTIGNSIVWLLPQ